MHLHRLVGASRNASEQRALARNQLVAFGACSSSAGQAATTAERASSVSM